MQVSICIPTYNGARFIAEAVRSALSQSEVGELVISDSGSTDGTLDIVREESAKASMPVRILGETIPGMVRNWNALIAAARCKYVKFLFQDDLLHHGCVEKMLVVAQENSRVGLVFCRRDLLIEESAKATPVAEYLLQYPELHEGFGRIGRLQPGSKLIGARNLLEQPRNKIGEPPVTLIRKDIAVSAGLFNAKMRQLVDWEFYLRMMAGCHVGFINEKLASFRVHGDQMSLENKNRNQDEGDESELLKTLVSPEIFGHLHRTVRVTVYRKAAASAIDCGATLGMGDQVYIGLREAYHSARKALHLAPAG